MKPHVQDILHLLEKIAPASLAEKWDNVGLLVGNPQNTVRRILIGLDPTNALVDEAIDRQVDTVITHHPVIFKPLSAIHTSDPAGRLLQKALAHDISIIGCHTNLDSAVDGVNDVLAEGLGLQQLIPLHSANDDSCPECGLGRIGRYPEPIAREQFLQRLFGLLKLEVINIAGELPDTLSTVALCGGSGSDFAQTAWRSGADVYLSAEIKHATAIWAKEVGFAIIDGTHYATEKPATAALANSLSKEAGEKNWNINVYLSETEEHPFVSVIHNTQIKTEK